MKYQDLKDGEWVRPIMRGYRLACCDCGLVHRMDFTTKGKHVEFRVRRDEAATRQERKRLEP